MKISLKFAQQLNSLMQGNLLAFSLFNKREIELFILDQILQIKLFGRNKKMVSIVDKHQLTNYLKHKFGINNLTEYILLLQNGHATVVDASKHASNSKIKSIRNITGFLVNSIQPIDTSINGQAIQLPMPLGTHCFISSYKNFIVSKNVIIVGIENAGNFINLNAQAYLFDDADYLFVSRYPQSGDLIKWLVSISNKYLHFGDFDLAGMHIYLHEIKKHLGERASYFLPNNLAVLFDKYANKKLFDVQYQKYRNNNFKDYSELKPLADIIYETGKCVEQQVLIQDK